MGKSERNDKPIKNRNPFETVLTIVLIIVSVLCFAVSGVLLYQKRYLSSFWVNGQSMYPTLNKDVTTMEGVPYGATGGGISGTGAKKLDYGVMDAHKSAINKVKRFDIVVCMYASEDETDKIKRVLGLPGETIKFNTTYTENRGELSVKQKDGSYKVVNQPIEKMYINSAAAYYPSGEITLAENEYFVCGDNRAHSSDCRGSSTKPRFAVEKDWIEGVVVAICGKCDAKFNGTDYEPTNIKYYFWPRFL